MAREPEVTIDDLVEEVCMTMSREELIEYVKRIDCELNDFRFTQQLFRYFRREYLQEHLL